MDLLGMNDSLHGTQFGPYSKNVGIYKCPCDVYLAPQGGLMMPRLRSVSMNCFVGCGPDQGAATGWLIYTKASDIVAPPPVLLYVTTDEHPDSINDAWLDCYPGGVGGWGDLPGSYHDGGTVFGFADGHVENHKWLDGWNGANGTGTVRPVYKESEGFSSPADPLRRDTAWFYARTSAPTQ
jgi:prepilin-type processing-associated H-X9-DG protein